MGGVSIRYGAPIVQPIGNSGGGGGGGVPAGFVSSTIYPNVAALEAAFPAAANGGSYGLVSDSGVGAVQVETYLSDGATWLPVTPPGFVNGVVYATAAALEAAYPAAAWGSFYGLVSDSGLAGAEVQTYLSNGAAWRIVTPRGFVNGVRYANAAALEVAYPAAAWNQFYGLVDDGGTGSQPRAYQSDGATWILLGTFYQLLSQNGGLDAGSLPDWLGTGYTVHEGGAFVSVSGTSLRVSNLTVGNRVTVSWDLPVGTIAVNAGGIIDAVDTAAATEWIATTGLVVDDGTEVLTRILGSSDVTDLVADAGLAAWMTGVALRTGVDVAEQLFQSRLSGTVASSITAGPPNPVGGGGSGVVTSTDAFGAAYTNAGSGTRFTDTAFALPIAPRYRGVFQVCAIAGTVATVDLDTCFGTST